MGQLYDVKYGDVAREAWLRRYELASSWLGRKRQQAEDASLVDRNIKTCIKCAGLKSVQNGDVAELVEGTSLLTRQGSNTFMSSNLIVSAKLKQSENFAETKKVNCFTFVEIRIGVARSSVPSSRRN